MLLLLFSIGTGSKSQDFSSVVFGCHSMVFLTYIANVFKQIDAIQLA